MKFITWLKSLGMVAVLGMIGAAIMMVWRAYQAGMLEAEVAHDEARIKQLKKGKGANIQAAARLQSGIGIKKMKAREIRKKSEASLERIGENETMADIATRFNNKRVRSRADTAAGV